MLLGNINSVHVNSILEPALFLGYLDIITAHLPLPHATIIGESPVLEPITPLPLHTIVLVLVLIPELHGDFVVCECEELFS